MAGLYIHIPFCESRCIYCGFYSTTSLSMRDDYVDALCKEMMMRPFKTATDYDYSLRTIYLGGGTPSQLTHDQLIHLFEGIKEAYFPPDHPEEEFSKMEITMECNPDDVSEEFCKTLLQLPVNRVSMGAQTFSDHRLGFLHRRHKAADVKAAIKRLRGIDIHNISIDLMFGFPGETLADWEQDIDEALRLGVEHISAYSLMYEEGTTLHRWLSEGRIQEIDDDLSLRMYDCLVDRLTAAGYRHYEISNFALLQRESRHNSSYWRDVPYMGLGASAHSFDGRQRSWNVADIETYIAAIGRGERPCTVEALDPDTHYEDVVLTSLRTAEGIDLDKIRRDFGSQRLDFLLAAADQDLRQGYLVREDDHLRLTRRGIYLSDGITARLFV